VRSTKLRSMERTYSSEVDELLQEKGRLQLEVEGRVNQGNVLPKTLSEVAELLSLLGDLGLELLALFLGLHNGLPTECRELIHEFLLVLQEVRR